MRDQRLGGSDLSVSAVGLGCWPFAGGKNWGDQSDADSIATVHAALDRGVTFFDTAENYGSGRSEEVLGRALAGRRNRAILATKVGAAHLRPDQVIAACEGSLRRLATDVIDLYYIHWPSPDVPLADTIGALDELREAGKIRAAAMCNFGPRYLEELSALGGGSLVAHQLPYSLFWRAIEPKIAPATISAGLGIVPYSPLAQGLLTGRYRTTADVPDFLKWSRYYDARHVGADHGERGCEAQLFAALDVLLPLAARQELPLAQLALTWVLAQPGVTSVLVGARRPDELADCLAAVELEPSGGVLEELTTISEPVRACLGSNPDMWFGSDRSRYR